MLFSLLVSRPPTTDPNQDKALQFATALLREGHQLYRVFFVAEGVSAALAGDSASSEATNTWAQLQQQHQLDLVACVTDFQGKYGPLACHPAFCLSGMGQLADASHHSERVVSIR